MQNHDAGLIKEAEELEKQSKIEIKNKNYDSAISLLLKAKDLYTQLGLTGQVGIVIKEVVRLKNLKRDQKIPATPSVDEIPNAETLIPNTPYSKEAKPAIKKDTVPLETKGNQILEEARNLAIQDNFTQAIKLYNEAYTLFKKLNHTYECKQILWQINEIKEYQRWGQHRKSKGMNVAVKDIVSLAAAEKRRLTIQKSLEEPKRERLTRIEPKIIEPEIEKHKLFQQISAKAKEAEVKKKIHSTILQEQQEKRKQLREERREKLKNIQEEKKREDLLTKNAEELLDKGNKSIQKKQYDDAKSYYEQAIEIFSNLGWHNQVKTLQSELRNLSIYKIEEERKMQQANFTKQQSQEKFQKRISSMLSEQERFKEKQMERMMMLPPEIKSKLEKAKLIKEKAEKEEKMDKFERVINRYQYILDLYKSIHKDSIDLSEEISNTEKIISELKKKL